MAGMACMCFPKESLKILSFVAAHLRFGGSDAAFHLTSSKVSTEKWLDPLLRPKPSCGWTAHLMSCEAMPGVPQLRSKMEGLCVMLSLMMVPTDKRSLRS